MAQGAAVYANRSTSACLQKCCDVLSLGFVLAEDAFEGLFEDVHALINLLVADGERDEDT